MSDPYRVGIDPASPAVPETGPSVWNIANVLTLVRLALVPVFGWLLLAHGGQQPGYRWAAFAVFALAMVTDRVDGDLARSRGLVTNVGKVLDPIADKALVTMALVGLSSVGEVMWWVTGLVLLREWGVTALRFWVIRHGVMAANRGGKLKTLLQTIGIGLFLWPRWTMPAPGLWDALAWVLLGAAVVLTVVTGLDYLVQALRLRRTSERAERKRAERAARRAGEAGPAS
ncbi:CDP-diacylglycerol--glycerol-3-phosphate 3-phosphatidyltransferase [Phycicoccus endophyticus]|uniref:CDP-diacylglycerol--glycerol-3-phosphate 3-phosphatidyltransferase n=2 Tax=Phycicoccus endophyticus TaxID=1690220 RepID=A0A7G9R3R9_9MICO|nr:CDP-diacylglycerol--glycerol-3-phosphate 3-phosphatidyltransferase [Phycicoccus endophyticus]NHI18067.1 CDP-diacylglycerol--glycerol-3-phosphate 3-phosphatidyltransferase [Phycicoccus endophyticus]QNN50244.1 CDP-diacylglycerol--glycerol-3-phosphate 3-phosphatidyltransferase [Phycicoccus endophyticus]